MKKFRRVLALFTAVTMTVAAIGCSKEVTAEDLMTNVETTNAPEVYIGESVCDKYSVAAFKMLRKAYSQEDTNVVISPAAIYTNLFMLSNGATGKTKNDLQGVLGKLYDSDFLNSNMNSFKNNFKDTDNTKLYFNNAMWFNSDRNITPSSEFLAAAKSFYNADAYKESFSKDAVRNINNWASNKTDMYAERIIKEIPADVPMYLVNTTLLEADWENPIRPADIYDGKFKTVSGNEQDAQMMSCVETVYMGNESVIGFMKNYAGGNYAFVAFIPHNDKLSLYELLDYMSREGAYREMIKNRKDYINVNAVIPKLSCRYNGEINEMLENAELGEIFSKEYDDFEDLGTCDENIYLGGFAVSTGLDITESGTKKGTGANTGIENNGVGESVSLDRPFVFAVVETKRYMPVIMGAVNSVK